MGSQPRIGLYRPGLSSPERLEHTTVGREETLRDLLEKLERSSTKKTHQHYAFVGPRGSGKSHFLSLLQHRVESSSELRAAFTVLRFPEAPHRLLSFADFALRICELLAERESDPKWRELAAELGEEEDDRLIADALEPAINSYRDGSGRVLLLLLEGLDEILTRQIKSDRDIHHLRKFLMTTPSCILVASARVMFAGLTDNAQPFYDFFDVQTLADLDLQQTEELIEKGLEHDGHRDLAARLGELGPAIAAVHELTGGNPRLVTMQYALLAASVTDVRRQVEELLDRVSPVFRDRIGVLPPQERAVLETMALSRSEPKTPALIARKLRKTPQQTSSLLQRLTRSGHVVVMDHPTDKRSKMYRIKDGFFDAWLSSQGSPERLARILDLAALFEVWYRHRAADGEPIEQLEEAIQLWRLQRAGPLEELAAQRPADAGALRTALEAMLRAAAG